MPGHRVSTISGLIGRLRSLWRGVRRRADDVKLGLRMLVRYPGPTRQTDSLPRLIGVEWFDVHHGLQRTGP